MSTFREEFKQRHYGRPDKLEWDYNEKKSEYRILMDNPLEPAMVKLREKYDLDHISSKADNDYEKLKLITTWGHCRLYHGESSHISSQDPLIILEEAAIGKKCRCVEYAIVTAACARSL